MSVPGPFRFNAATHEYTLGCYRIPGLSEILEAGGEIRNKRWYTRTGRTRGSLAHEAIEQHDLRLIDLHDVDGPLRGWALAYLKALDDLQPTHTHIETAVVNRHLGIATTIDRAGWLLGRRATWNIKTGDGTEPWWGVQRAGEVLALDGRASRRARYTLKIRANGKYSLIEHTDRSEFDAFLDALLQWRLSCWRANLHPPLDRLERLRSAEARLRELEPRRTPLQ